MVPTNRNPVETLLSQIIPESFSYDTMQEGIALFMGQNKQQTFQTTEELLREILISASHKNNTEELTNEYLLLLPHFDSFLAENKNRFSGEIIELIITLFTPLYLCALNLSIHHTYEDALSLYRFCLVAQPQHEMIKYNIARIKKLRNAQRIDV